MQRSGAIGRASQRLQPGGAFRSACRGPAACRGAASDDGPSQSSGPEQHDAAHSLPPRMVRNHSYHRMPRDANPPCIALPIAHMGEPHILQLAAMALSPLAALSLPLVQNEGWMQSMREFGENLRRRARDTVDRDATKAAVHDLDDGLTFMDWTYRVTGVDLTYVWDPELWVKFKDAVWHDQPTLFWNALMDRIEYSESRACMRAACVRPFVLPCST